MDAAIRGLTVDPGVLLGPLGIRMARLSEQERFEEAAEVRDGAVALARALIRQGRIDALRSAGRVTLELEDGTSAVLRDGRLVSCSGGPLSGGDHAVGPWRALAERLGPDPETSATWPRPLARQHADEAAVVASWLEGNAGRVRVLAAEHGWSHQITGPGPNVTACFMPSS